MICHPVAPVLKPSFSAAIHFFNVVLGSGSTIFQVNEVGDQRLLGIGQI